MRLGVAMVVVLAGLVGTTAAAAPGPTYTVAFQGSGSEHRTDVKRNVEDDGECYAADHVDVTAGLSWSATWKGFRTGATPARAASSAVDGSRFTGTNVKDACGEDLDEAPEGWVSEASCDDALTAAGGPRIAVATRGRAIVLAVTAPGFSVPAGAQCPLNVRNDQFSAHAAVQPAKLRALKRGQSLTLQVGSGSPGPGDRYAPDLDCSVPTKPYDGYRTDDHCEDQLSWSGTVTVTRAS